MKGLLFLLVPAVVAAQENRVDPSINEPYENPNVENLVDRLEREGRPAYEARHAIVAALGLKPGDDVADVGAGSGFFTRLMAREVGPHGRVYAVEISEEMVEHNLRAAREEGLENVVGILGGETSTNLPEDAIDLAFICDTYHHFEYPSETMQSIERALRPDGQLVVIDYERIRGVTSERRMQHLRGGKGTFTDEIVDAGFELVKELPLIPENYFLVFRKRVH